MNENRYSELDRVPDIDDIDRSEDGDYGYERRYEASEDGYYSDDAEAEWEESKEQINALFSLVVFPFVGKWLGKKFSFWAWSRWLSYTPPVGSTSFLAVEWIDALKRLSS
ncbi:hypothetical protein PHYBLDRAFT_143196 [Phycomyces blakesleeanus NRRL 1555(-)]|uniref:Uncharacterized protein n=2 Tax=Phycomyces blakesleeanus TaxID=4837 RepID=A0A162UH46_PHYB8|nr:hypothetical protein PHYBLDRAFT_143196 [Phycomyces blakesleeanus NRRL 1555(-)]OAD76212.1 hypothetical protein PHYBLDRAFT_143196 [Phycomyces blakesleeanus NRRL 1555(-)]|eukprot:XP_018294252.1 hypothetical protein PHYBLDRAFT_143196 [Phycomyces blakesleeanus NRRL 1555(-)]